MIVKEYYKTREDGVNIFRRYSDITPYLKQLPTGVIYNCWVYKLDENGDKTNEVDWELSGVYDVENAPYTYVETDQLIENGDILNENVEEQN